MTHASDRAQLQRPIPIRALAAAGSWLDTPVPQGFCVQDPVVLVALLAVAIPAEEEAAASSAASFDPLAAERHVWCRNSDSSTSLARQLVTACVQVQLWFSITTTIGAHGNKEYGAVYR